MPGSGEIPSPLSPADVGQNIFHLLFAGTQVPGCLSLYMTPDQKGLKNIPVFNMLVLAAVNIPDKLFGFLPVTHLALI